MEAGSGAGREGVGLLTGVGLLIGVGLLLEVAPVGWGRYAKWCGASVSTATAIAVHNVVTRPPVAAPMAKARRSQRNSLCRRSRSCGGSEARRAAQLL